MQFTIANNYVYQRYESTKKQQINLFQLFRKNVVGSRARITRLKHRVSHLRATD